VLNHNCPEQYKIHVSPQW